MHYRKTCKAFDEPGQAHALTFSCFGRQRFLSRERSCRWTIDAIRQAGAKYGFQLWAYVLMPEHVHLMLGEPKRSKLEDIFRALKTQTSKRLKGDRLQFWQRRYYDFNAHSEEKRVEKIRYIHRNLSLAVSYCAPKTIAGAASPTTPPANLVRSR